MSLPTIMHLNKLNNVAAIAIILVSAASAEPIGMASE